MIYTLVWPAALVTCLYPIIFLFCVGVSLWAGVSGGGGVWRGEVDIERAGKAELFAAASSPNSTKTRAKKRVVLHVS